MARENIRSLVLSRAIALFIGFNLGAVLSVYTGLETKEDGLHSVARFSTFIVLFVLLRAYVRHHYPDDE